MNRTYNVPTADISQLTEAIKKLFGDHNRPTLYNDPHVSRIPVDPESLRVAKEIQRLLSKQIAPHNTKK